MPNSGDGFAAYFARFKSSTFKCTYHPLLEGCPIIRHLAGSELAEWSPQPATTDLKLGPVFTQLTPPAREYFRSWWFLWAGGHFHDYVVSLDPLTPNHAKSISSNIEDYWRERSEYDPGSHLWLPIGLSENSGDRILLENSPDQPRIAIEDVHDGRITPICDSVFQFLSELEPRRT